MQRYQNSVVGRGGVLIATPTITVRVANATPNAGAKAILFSDNAVSPTSLANELRMTCADPTGGNLDVVVGYFIIDNS